MLSRLPVLACDSGGPVESVLDPRVADGIDENERTGWLRPPDADAWANALLDILNMPEEERSSLGERARRRAIEMFALSTMAENIEKALQEAINLGPVNSQSQDIFTCLRYLFILVVIVAIYIVIRR